MFGLHKAMSLILCMLASDLVRLLVLFSSFAFFSPMNGDGSCLSTSFTNNKYWHNIVKGRNACVHIVYIMYTEHTTHTHRNTCTNKQYRKLMINARWKRNSIVSYFGRRKNEIEIVLSIARKNILSHKAGQPTNQLISCVWSSLHTKCWPSWRALSEVQHVRIRVRQLFFFFFVFFFLFFANWWNIIVCQANHFVIRFHMFIQCPCF